MSNYYKINYYDTGNGPGLRVTIFFCGCEHYCKNCFNQELWDFNIGKPFTRKIYKKEIKPAINDHIAGISILGGEPLNPHNIEATANLINWFAEDFPNKNIWIWTGYTWEELMFRYWKNKNNDGDVLSWIISSVHVLIDGKFIEEEKDLTLKWRGSKNQRVIDVQKTLKEGKVILYEKAY